MRQALARLLALTEAGEKPDAAAFGEALARLDEALKALDALEKAGPLRVLPGGRGEG